MSNVRVCVRFRPLSHKERKGNGDKVCFKKLDAESFVFKDERDEDVIFSFDKVFYDDAEQSDVYNFLAVPIVTDAVNGINGTIITYGQTGAGKTYSMEGPSILHCNEQKTGLVQRVVDDLFECLRTSASMATWTVNLSMVEIYLEKVRDLLDLSKDNLQIKESKSQGIYISGATEVRKKYIYVLPSLLSSHIKKSARHPPFRGFPFIYGNCLNYLQISIMNSSDALERLSEGIANRAVGETQMNLASSRSHCLYIFSVQHTSTPDERVRAGKIILVDLAGSEKVEKTGAEGRVLDEAKTINKSLSALGNVINALTTGKSNHVPYRDSKLTRILQDSLGGSSRASLLCCCSPSASNSTESLSTLRFGTRTKLIKTVPKPIPVEAESGKKPTPQNSHDQDDPSDGAQSKPVSSQSDVSDPSLDSRDQDDVRDRILTKLRSRLSEEDVDLLEELFVQEGIIFNADDALDPGSVACQDAAGQQILSLLQAVEELSETARELAEENEKLRHELEVAQDIAARAAAAAAAAAGWGGGLLLGFLPAAVLRPFGFVPD